MSDNEPLPIEIFRDGEYVEPDESGEDEREDGEEEQDDDDRYDAEGAPSPRRRVPPDADEAPMPHGRPQIPRRPVPAPQPAPVSVAAAPAPTAVEPTPIERPARQPRPRRAPPPPVAVAPPSRSGDVPLATWLSQFDFQPGVCWGRLTRLAPVDAETTTGRMPVSGILENEFHVPIDENYITRTWGGQTYMVEVFDTAGGDGQARSAGRRQVLIGGPPTAYSHGGVRVPLPPPAAAPPQPGAAPGWYRPNGPPNPWRRPPQGFEDDNEEYRGPPRFYPNARRSAGYEDNGSGGASLLDAVQAAAGAARTRTEDVEMARITSQERQAAASATISTLTASAEQSRATVENLLASRGQRDETMIGAIKEQLTAAERLHTAEMEAQRRSFDVMLSATRADLERVRKETEGEIRRNREHYESWIAREREQQRADLDRERENSRRDAQMAKSNHDAQLAMTNTTWEGRLATEKAALQMRVDSVEGELRTLRAEFARVAGEKNVSIEDQMSNLARLRESVGTLFGLQGPEAAVPLGVGEPKNFGERFLDKALERGILDKAVDRFLTIGTGDAGGGEQKPGRFVRGGRRAPAPPGGLPLPPRPAQRQVPAGPTRTAPPPPVEAPWQEQQEPMAQAEGLPEDLVAQATAQLDEAARTAQRPDEIASEFVRLVPHSVLVSIAQTPTADMVEAFTTTAAPDAVLRTPYGQQFLADVHGAIQAQLGAR